MPRTRRTGRLDRRVSRNAFAASGWLMAEVALILMVVFQGSQDPSASASAPDGEAVSTGGVVTPGADPSDPTQPTTTESPEPPEPCAAPGLLRQPEEIASVVVRGPGDRLAARTLISRIDASADHRPGLILLFGVSYSSASPNGGQSVSEDLERLLAGSAFGRRYRPVVRPFLKVYGPQYKTGEVFADVYYYGRGSSCE